MVRKTALILFPLCLFVAFKIVKSAEEKPKPEPAIFGESCSGAKPCDEIQLLECDPQTSKCRCSNENQTLFDNNEKMCKIRVNEVCTEGENAQQCVSNAKCIPDSKSTTQRCKCHAYARVSRGQCFADFLGPCSGIYGLPCDTQAFMECKSINNRPPVCVCGAHEDMVFDEIKKVCALLEGATCAAPAQESEANSPPCVEYAECKNSRCTCVKGVQNSKGRKCFSNYREPCGGSGESDCRPGVNLVCESGKCLCKGEQITATHNECQLKAGANCTLGGQSCLERETCSKKTGQCTCDPGLTPNRLKHCTLPFGASCKDPATRYFCDGESFVQCSPESFTCGCGPLLLEHGICKLKAHMQCSTGNHPYHPQCTENSVCKRNGDAEICECIEPLIKNKESRCVRKYNETCGQSLPGSCDLEAFQTCHGGRCACEDPENMEFVEKTESCVVKLNGSCKTGSRSSPCAELLVCNSSGYCTCDAGAGYFVNEEGKCVKPFGAPCDIKDVPEGFCDTSSYHSCKYEACECDANHKEKEEGSGSGKPCVGKAGAKCKTNANCNAEKKLICDLAKGECKNSKGSRSWVACGLLIASVSALAILAWLGI